MQLYHYRSIDSALKEIDNGTFHFSCREELNDPLEGYLRVYWQGDEAAWEGLLKNYICSLLLNICDYYLKVDGFILPKQGLVRDLCQFDNQNIQPILNELTDQFLINEEIKKVVDVLGKSKRKCYSEHLICTFLYIQPLAFKICFEIGLKHELFAAYVAEDLVKKYSHGYAINDSQVTFSKFFGDSERMERISEKLMTIMPAIISDISELWLMGISLEYPNILNGSSEKDIQNVTKIDEKSIRAREWVKVSCEFPYLFLEELKSMLYPKGYFVCFSSKGDISPMWGNYADHHKGVCLIYETDVNNSLKVNVNFNGFRPLSVKPVLYDGEVIERNFFETLGRLTRPQILKWLSGKNGISSCYEAFKDEAAWREKYWEIFAIKNYRKLASWSYENEYRAEITNYFYDLENPLKRNFQYDPQSLKGLVFGIKTTEYDKKLVYDALLKKKKLLEPFTFYQADYDEEKQKIVIRKKANWELK